MRSEKKELRKSIQKKLSTISASSRQNDEGMMRGLLFSLNEWDTSETIGITVSRGNEINTYPIIEKAWDQGKTVVVPKCNPTDFSMDFRKLSSFEELETVYFGLKEPIVSETESKKPNQIDLLFVPGLLFDQQGYRIGFGGGYYDRFLEHYTGHTVSLLHSIQLTETVPKEPFDQPVDLYILPDRILRTNNTR